MDACGQVDANGRPSTSILFFWTLLDALDDFGHRPKKGEIVLVVILVPPSIPPKKAQGTTASYTYRNFPGRNKILRFNKTSRHFPTPGGVDSSAFHSGSLSIAWCNDCPPPNNHPTGEYFRTPFDYQGPAITPGDSRWTTNNIWNRIPRAATSLWGDTCTWASPIPPQVSISPSGTSTKLAIIDHFPANMREIFCAHDISKFSFFSRGVVRPYGPFTGLV